MIRTTNPSPRRQAVGLLRSSALRSSALRSSAARASRSLRSRALILGVVCSCLVAAGCSGSSELPADIRPQAIDGVRGVAASTGLSLSDVDAGCAADALGLQRATVLIDQGDAIGSELLAGVLDEIIECVGADTIARSAIAPQAPGASEESIACAAERFDDDLLVTLLAGSDTSSFDLGVQLELELATVLASCLTPEELLDLGQ